jgi:hypothetical protein
VAQGDALEPPVASQQLGTYLVIGSSTEPMRRSPMAIPTRAESTDLAIDIDVRVESWS